MKTEHMKYLRRH